MTEITHKEFFGLLEDKTVVLLCAGRLNAQLQNLEALEAHFKENIKYYKSQSGINSGILRNTGGTRYYRQDANNNKNYGDLKLCKVYVHTGLIILLKNCGDDVYIMVYKLSAEEQDGIPLF